MKRTLWGLIGAFAVILAAPATIASAQSVDKTISADGAGSQTTAAFTTAAANELLVAFVASDGPVGGGQAATVTGAGLTWTLVRRVNTQPGTAEIWSAKAAAILTNVTVTSTETLGGYYQSLTVVTFTGAAGTGASAGASATTGAPTVSLVTTQAGSLVYGVGDDWDNAVAHTPGASQALVHQYLAPSGDTFWTQNRTAPIATAGTSVQISDTAPTADRWNLAAVEIVAAVGPGFSVAAYNDTITAGLSDFVTYNMWVSPIAGFTGPLACGVSNGPANAALAIEPAGGPLRPGPIALNVTTSATTPPGTYHPLVTCTSGSLTASKSVTLIATNLPDFRTTLEPNSLVLSQGQTGVANFAIQAMNNYVQGVTLSVSGLPAGVTPTFSPGVLIPPGTGTFQIAVGGATTPGVYPLVVTASDGTLSRQAAFTLTVRLSGGGSWRQQALGDTPAHFYGSIVGDPGNTLKNRVYGSAGNGLVYEYAFNGFSWSHSLVPFGVTSDGEMHNGMVGPGRGDGINRLYIAATQSGRVYEASWVNNSWQVAVIATVAGATDVFVGDGRNDGRVRTYVSAQGGLSEFTWTGAVWAQVVMSSTEGGEVHGLVIGPGRSDGINRVYTANAGNGQVNEYSWNGAAWLKLLVGTDVDVRNVELGDGHNDGTLRAYAASADGNVYEHTWNGSAWQKVSIGNAGVTAIKVHASPQKAKGDNTTRIYVSAADGGVYEYVWTGTAWQTLQLGSATAFTYGLGAGDGLNKGTTQIYGSSADGNVYLFEWVPAVASPITVPNVVNLIQSAAQTSLTSAGLTVGTVTVQSSVSVPAGAVSAQNPVAGAQVASGTPVNLIVSSGPPPPVNVPNVVGQTQAAAQSTLIGAGLTVGTVTIQPSVSVPAGSVISESPVAGTSVAAGSAVGLVVSSGPPPVAVPSVVNMAQAAAATTLTTAGLLVGTVSNVTSAIVPAGSVVSQTPIAGTIVAGGTSVALVISSGPAPTIASLSPASGAPGTVVTISGANLGSSLLNGKTGWWGPFQSGVAPNNLIAGKPNGAFVGTPVFTTDGGGAITSTDTNYLNVADGGTGGTYDWSSGPWSAQVDFFFPAAPVFPSGDSFLLVSKGSFALGNGWELEINNVAFQGKYQIELESNHGVGSFSLVTAYLITPGAFHRALIVCDGAGNGTWYVNGTAWASQPCLAPSSASTDLTIGRYSASTGFAANFPISRVQVWNRALTATEATLSTTVDPMISTVTFNGTPAVPASWSATSIVAPVPSAATTGNVVVTVGTQASNGVAFTVTAPPPGITTIAPLTAAVGTSVTISGVNFGATRGTSTVTFNGTAATPTTWSATSIVVPVPAGATTGNVVVTVAAQASNGVPFTVTAPPPTQLAVDKTVFSDGVGTRTTAAFSTTSAGEVLFAFVASDGPTSAGVQSATVSGAGLTWTLVNRANTQFGTSEIWTATAANQLSNVTVTATQTQNGFYQSLNVVAFTGAGGVGASAIANAATGAPVVSLTATKAGSLVYGVGNDWDNATARTAGSGQTIVHQYLAPAGDTFWVQAQTNAVAIAGAVVQMNDTAPTADRWNFAAVEVTAK